MCLYLEVSNNPCQCHWWTHSEKCITARAETFVLPLAITVQSIAIDFVLGYTWYYEWREYLFSSPNQAWLGRAISTAMKSVFQARSTMVRSPALQPSIKETFPPLWGAYQHPQPKVQVQKFHCPRRGGWKFVLGLIVFGVVSGCNYSETSLKNHKALVWFGQTYDMKSEHDDWEPCSLQSSTNKIIFSQIGFCLFFSFPARWSINNDTFDGCRKGCYRSPDRGREKG